MNNPELKEAPSKRRSQRSTCDMLTRQLSETITFYSWLVSLSQGSSYLSSLLI